MPGQGPSYGSDHRLTGREALFILGLVALLVIGGGLYSAGYNESFYSEDEGVRDVFEVLTDLGHSSLYLVILLSAFYAYDMAFGRRLAWVFFFVLFVTELVSQFVQDPRPPTNQLRTDPLDGFGFPSGHSTTSVCFYGYILLSHLDGWRSRWPVLAICGFAVVVVPVSRLVIGVHDVQDVVGACAIVLAILPLYMLLQPRVARAREAMSPRGQVLLGALGVLLLWALAVLVLGLRRPAETEDALEAIGRSVGLLFGCAVAFPLEEAYVGFRPGRMTRVAKVMAVIVGLAISVPAYAAVGELVEAVLPPFLAKMLGYFTLIVVATLVVPYVLERWVSGVGRVDGPPQRSSRLE